MTQNIGSLAVSLSLDANSFNGSMQRVDRNLRAMGSELRAVQARGSAFGNSIEGLSSRQDILRRSLEAANIKLTDARRRYDEMVASGTASEAQLERQARRVNDAQTQFNRLETELNQVSEALRLQSSSWHQLSERLESLGSRLTTIGQRVTTVGRDLSLKVTAPLVAMGATAFKTAADFESAFAGVRKTIDTSEEGFAKLESGIRGMSKELPTAATEIAAVAESAGQLGIAEDNILGFTRTIIDLGEATNLTREQAATEFARFANITQMPQTEFSRLGSAVVALGNTMATTESEIVSMGMRLAAQGAQVGMTEAQIMALAGTMSSLGIQAEMGGTAMTTILKKIQTAVGTGGKDLTVFAKVAGMTGSEFKKAFEADAVTALDALVKGLANSSGEGKNLTTILADLGIKGVYESDVLLRMAGASDLLSSAVNTSTNAWKENNALTNEAEQRYKTTASKLTIMWNKVKDLGITIGNILIPIITDLVSKLEPIIKKFAEMDTETQKTILAIGGVAAAIGPLLVIGGTLVSSLGAIFTAFSTVSGALAVVTTGVAASTPAIGALASAFTILSGPVGWTIAGLTALTVGGVKLYNHLQKDVIPVVDRFGEGVSKSTKKALVGFFELSDGASLKLKELTYGQQRITDEMATGLIESFSKMNNQILAKMDERHSKEFEKLQTHFLNSRALTDAEEQNILAKIDQRNNDEAERQRMHGERINEILETAAAENRQLTEREQKVINQIQQQMNETAVNYLSQSEVESKVILERMKQTAGDLSAKQAAEVVANSHKQKEDVIKEANEQYIRTVDEIEKMRDEMGVITADQAEKLIAEATKQRDQSVKLAEDMHLKVVEEAKKQAGEHIDTVDWQTGEILSKWEVFKNNTSKKLEEIKQNASEKWVQMKKDISTKYEEMKNTASIKIEDMKKSIKDKAELIRSDIESAWNKAKSFLESIDLMQIGKDIIQGLINGIGSMGKAVWEKAKQIGQSIADSVSSVLQRKSPSRVMMAIGKDVGEGLAIGIENSDKRVSGASRDLASTVDKRFTKTIQEIAKQADNAAAGTKKSTEKIKKSFNEAFLAVQHQYKTGKFTASQYVDALKIVSSNYAKTAEQQRKTASEILKIEKLLAEEKQKNDKISFDTSKNWIDKKKQLNEISLAEELAAWERVQARYKVGSKEREEAEQNIYRVKKDIHDKLTSLNNEYVGKMQEINQKLIDGEKALNEEYKKAVEDRTRSLYSFAGIFDEIKEKSDVSGQQLIENLRGQVTTFAEWSTNIKALAERGIDEGLLSELREMGPKASAEIAALNGLTDIQLQEYAELWRTKNEMARKQATEELEGLKQDTQKKIEELHINSAAQLEKLRVEWNGKVKQIRTGTTNEFNAMKAETPDIGKQAMKGLLDGMEGMRGSLMATARSIANEISTTISAALDIRSPSRVMMKIGNYAGEGLELGLKAKFKAVANAGEELARAVVHSAGNFDVSSPSFSGVNNSGMRTIPTINQVVNIHSPKNLSPAETARLQKRASQELALEWR